MTAAEIDLTDMKETKIHLVLKTRVAPNKTADCSGAWAAAVAALEHLRLLSVLSRISAQH
jgi:hypothetical protein